MLLGDFNREGRVGGLISSYIRKIQQYPINMKRDRETRVRVLFKIQKLKSNLEHLADPHTLATSFRSEFRILR